MSSGDPWTSRKCPAVHPASGLPPLHHFPRPRCGKRIPAHAQWTQISPGPPHPAPPSPSPPYQGRASAFTQRWLQASHTPSLLTRARSLNPALGLAARAGSPESPAPIPDGENNPQLLSKVKTSCERGLPRIYDARSGPSSLARPETDPRLPGLPRGHPLARPPRAEPGGGRSAAGSDRIAAAGGRRRGFLLPVPLPPTCRGSQQPPSPRRVRRPRAVPESFLRGLRISGPGARPRATPLPAPPRPPETPRSPISPSSSSSSSSSISSRTSLVIMGMSPPAARNLAQSWGLLGVRNFGSLTGRAPGQGRQGASHSRLRGRCAQPALGESGPKWCVQDNLWPPEPGRATEHAQ